LSLLLGALPGQEEAISNWFKDLAVHVLTFPAILFVIFLSVTVLNAAAADSINRIQTIPVVGQDLIAAASGFVLPFVALIILLYSFKVPGMIERAIKGGKRR
jgi:uncharacterized BrkB/YihY/UPF0761 family membrane protein